MGRRVGALCGMVSNERGLIGRLWGRGLQCRAGGRREGGGAGEQWSGGVSGGRPDRVAEQDEREVRSSTGEREGEPVSNHAELRAGRVGEASCVWMCLQGVVVVAVVLSVVQVGGGSCGVGHW